MARRASVVDSARGWILRTPPALPGVRALLTPVAAHTFEELRISVSFWNARDFWHSIVLVPNIGSFELEHGVQGKRWPYNHKNFALVQRARKIHWGRHAGFFDLFVPLFDSSGFRGVFVAGPVSKSRPNAPEILERWYALSGTHGRLGDASFLQYVIATLSTLTLEGALWAAFERLIVCFASLVGEGESPDRLAEEADVLRRKLLEARFEEHMWAAARSMLNERTTQSWATPDQARPLWELGLKRVPEDVLVGLLGAGPQEDHALDAFLRRHDFQRACAGLARKMGGAIAGQVGNQGVVFLTDDSGSESRARARLTELATRAGALARRFGFKLHAGIGQPKREDPLAARYLAAFGAAEMALSREASIVYGERRSEHSAKHLRKLRQQLAESVVDRRTLSSRFEHYAQTVLEHCGYQLEPVRAKLEAGLESLSQPLLATGALDERSFDELWSAIERSVAEEGTVTALVARYRQLVSDIERAMQSPTRARHERNVERALRFMREHLGEPLTLPQVARAAGFAPDYFSKLFKQSESITFERYLLRLRLERAKQILVGTSLNVEGVSRMCGFKNRMYFHRAFKSRVGITPVEFRERGVFRGVG
jgi:AraC-like DNA-binding protein